MRQTQETVAQYLRSGYQHLRNQTATDQRFASQTNVAIKSERAGARVSILVTSPDHRAEEVPDLFSYSPTRLGLRAASPASYPKGHFGEKRYLPGTRCGRGRPRSDEEVESFARSFLRSCSFAENGAPQRCLDYRDRESAGGSIWILAASLIIERRKGPIALLIRQVFFDHFCAFATSQRSQSDPFQARAGLRVQVSPFVGRLYQLSR